MKSPYWDVIITGRSDATVNGVQVEMVVPSNVYSSVFQHLAAEARQAGRPVLARGVDETRSGVVVHGGCRWAGSRGAAACGDGQ